MIVSHLQEPNSRHERVVRLAILCIARHWVDRLEDQPIWLFQIHSELTLAVLLQGMAPRPGNSEENRQRFGRLNLLDPQEYLFGVGLPPCPDGFPEGLAPPSEPRVRYRDIQPPSPRPVLY